MKKTLIVLLSLLLLALSGCSNRVPDEGGTSSIVSPQAETETSGGNFDDNFPITGFAQKTHEELTENFSYAIYYNERMMEGVMDTPASLLINSMNRNVLLTYDKLTGVFAEACRDTLCNHESCMWGASSKRIYCGSNGLFFLVDEEEQTTLYQTDFTGSDIKKLYSSGDELFYVVQEEAYIYFLQEFLDEETDTTVTRLMRLKVDGSDTDILLEKSGLYYYMPMGGNILYLDQHNGFMLYNTETEETQVFGSTEMLPLALFDKTFYYELDGDLYRKSNYGAGEAVLLMKDATIVELIFDGDKVYFHDGSKVYEACEDFSKITEVYNAETEQRISNVIVDDNLLFYRYTERKGSARKHYFCFVDLATGESLEVVNE